VLLVDDDPEVLDVQAQILSRLGYCVTAFRDPQEAFARFRDDPCRFDLVITDEIMPGLRGTEMAALIRGIRPDLPIMIVTAGLEVERTRGKTKALHIGNVFLKPFDKSGLAAAIDAILRKSRRKRRRTG
jgi:DNA-binding response OmpR family regulator